MRWLIPLAAFAALTFAPVASAQTVSVGDISFGPQLEHKLTHKLGEREGPVLQQMLSEEIVNALHRAGADVQPGGDVTIETTIIDADPNQPTVQELSDRPGLSMIDSVSVGGARLHGVIRAHGEVIAEIDHSRYSNSLADVVQSPGEWTDTIRAFRGYADKVARAYAAHAH